MTHDNTDVPSDNSAQNETDEAKSTITDILEYYSFERKKEYDFQVWKSLLLNIKKWNEESDLKLFKHRIKLPDNAPDEVKELVERYARASLKNIFYYRRKLVVENFWRYSYSVFTFLIVITVPIFIFVYTDRAVRNNSNNVDALEAVSVVLTAMLTTLIGMHQLISSWAGKRKFRALFHQAKMDLMEVHFDIEEQAPVSFKSPYDYDYSGLAEVLRSSTKKCKEIVNSETKQYFELSGSPVVDLGNLFSSSMSTASSLVSSFTSKKYSSRLEELKAEEKEKKEKLGANKDKLQQKNIALKSAYRKVARLERRTQTIDDQMDELESQGLDNLSPQDRDKYDKLEAKFDAFDDERDELADEIESLIEEIEELEITMEEYQK